MRCPKCNNWLARIVGTNRLLCVDGCGMVWLTKSAQEQRWAESRAGKTDGKK